MERFYFHANRKRDDTGLMMTGFAAMRRHVHAVTIANASSPLSLVVTDEEGRQVYELSADDEAGQRGASHL